MIYMHIKTKSEQEIKECHDSRIDGKERRFNWMTIAFIGQKDKNVQEEKK